MNSKDLALWGEDFMNAVEEARFARKAVRRASDMPVIPSLLENDLFNAHRKVGLLLYSLSGRARGAEETDKNLEDQP